MQLANAPSARPTNKTLTMFGGFVVTTPMVSPFVDEVWPQLAPTVLAGPAATDAVAALLAALLSMAVAWFVPDQSNVAR